MHEKECEKSFVGSITEGSNMVTKVEADTEYEDNEEIKMEQNPSEVSIIIPLPYPVERTILVFVCPSPQCLFYKSYAT
jgi:hypothetical protein